MRNLENYLGEEFAKLQEAGVKDSSLDGVKILNFNDEGIIGLEVTIEPENSLGRKSGNYFTFDLPDFSMQSKNKMTKSLTKAIKKLLPKKYRSVLVLGMGNAFIISDSLGTRTVEFINVLDIMEMRKDLRFYKFCPGVFSVTGYESYDLSRAVTSVAEADVVIIVDSLCTKTTERLGKSFQVSDAGIVPGSAVGSQVCDLSNKTLFGAKTISIGVPVVVYLQSVVEEIIKNIHPLNQDDLRGALTKFDDLDMIFSPKDIDFLVDFSARIVSQAILEAF